jgi:predicted nucleic acid-binding protein
MRVVDASVWVSYLIAEDENHVASFLWLQPLILAGAILVEPSLILPEVSASVRRRLNEAEATSAIDFLQSLPGMVIFDVDARGLAQTTAQIAASVRLTGADSIYVALAYELTLPFYTWDNQIIDRAGGLITVQRPT